MGGSGFDGGAELRQRGALPHRGLQEGSKHPTPSALLAPWPLSAPRRFAAGFASLRPQRGRSSPFHHHPSRERCRRGPVTARVVGMRVPGGHRRAVPGVPLPGTPLPGCSVPRDPQLRPDSPRSSRREPRLRQLRPQDISSEPSRRTELGALAGQSPRLRHGVGRSGLCAEAASEHLRAVASAGEEVGDSSSVPAGCGFACEGASPGFLPVALQPQLAGCCGCWQMGPGKRGGPGGAAGQLGLRGSQKEPAPLPCPARCWSSARRKPLPSSQPAVQMHRRRCPIPPWAGRQGCRQR